MYGKVSGKISLKTPKHPVNPYGEAKLKAFNITKFYREKFNLKTYNAVIFNTESLLRRKEFLIPKICLAAIKAKKKALHNATVGKAKKTTKMSQQDAESDFLELGSGDPQAPGERKG